MVKDTTLYDRLEITSQATETEIKKSFMRLSKIWHPDKNNNSEESTVKFQELNEAKEILLDSQKRQMYDDYGFDAINNDNGGNDMQNPFGGFEHFFGGGGFNFNSRQRHNQEEYEDIEETLNIQLNQLYNEETIDFSYNYKQYCVPCNGEGTKNGLSNKCSECNGKGMKVQIIKMGPMIQQVMINCNLCNGSGKVINNNNKCTTCNGSCFIKKDKTIQIPLKSGLKHGNIITMQNKGNCYKNNKSNLKIKINELKHNIFTHINDDLFLVININLYQALFGFHKIINHLDNRELYITTNKLTNFNSIKKISNEGMKNINQKNKGDLYIKFNIILPKTDLLNINPEFKEYFKRLLLILDQDEVKKENLIENCGLSKNELLDCNQVISDNILKLINNINSNDNHTNTNNKQEKHDTQPNCVQS